MQMTNMRGVARIRYSVGEMRQDNNARRARALRELQIMASGLETMRSNNPVRRSKADATPSSTGAEVIRFEKRLHILGVRT
jgi:hypothetical protein